MTHFSFNVLFELFKRVNAFGQKFPAVFPPDSFAGQCLATIGAAITELREQVRLRGAVSAELEKQEASRAGAREQLIDGLAAVNGAARAIDRDQPGFLTHYNLRRDASDQVLVRTAAGFVEHAAAREDLFVRYDVTPGFVQEIHAASSRLEEEIARHEDGKRALTLANASIEETVDKAMDAFYKFSALVPTKLKDDENALQEWQVVRRFTTAMRSAKPAKAAPGSDPPPGSTAATSAA